MSCSSDIHNLPTDRALSERIKSKTLRPQTDISKVKISDVHGHGREVENFAVKEAEKSPGYCS